MGCLSSSPASPSLSRVVPKLKISAQNNALLTTQEAFHLSETPSSADRQKGRRKVNKVQFLTHDQNITPTQNIVLSTDQITVDDKEMVSDVLSKNYIFHKLSLQQRKQLLQRFQIYDSKYNQSHQHKGEYLFKKNDVGTMFFIIKSGNVQIQLNEYEQKQNQKKIIYRRGDSFGQLALLYKTLRSASVKCLGKCTFLCISSNVFRESLQKIVERTIESNKILIERIKLFTYLTTKQKNKLANNIVILKYEKGDIIFRQGEQSLAFFVILSGKVQIDVKNKPLLELKVGDYFGQSCFQSDAKRSGTVQCVQKTQVMSISRIALKKVLGQQTQEFYYFSILKWALKRNPIFNQIPQKSIEKLLKQCDIVCFANDHEILKQGEKIRKLYISIEGLINQFQMGDIVNCQFLEQIQKDRKKPILNPTTLTKSKQGYVCVIDIGKVLSLLQKHSIVISNLASNEFQNMKKEISSKRQLQEANSKSMRHLKQRQSSIHLENLTMVKKVGEGQFGSIYKVRHILDNSFYALKTFKKSDVDSYKMRHFIKQEVQVMQMIQQHSHIVSYKKYFQTEEYFLILMELIDGKDFFDTILEIGWLSSDQIRFFFATFVLGLEAMHERDIIYRDVKPENAVIEPSGYLKLIDFGTARKLTPSTGYRSFTIIGTPHYMAPEVVAAKGYSFQADIWSMGVLLYELACGKFPFGEKLEQPIQIYNQIIKPNLSITYPKQLTDKTLKRLIQRLLVKDPIVRQIQNFNEIKESEFYQGFQWQKFQNKTMKTCFKTQIKHNFVDEIRDKKKFTEESLNNFLERLKVKQKKENQEVVFQNWDDFI